MKPLYVSFFTANTPYEEQSRGLVETLDVFGLEYVVESSPNFGGWAANCQHKPVFLQKMMSQHPGRPIVWLDSDARVRKYPSLFDSLDCDFAAVWRTWPTWTELLSGTIYFGPTPAAEKCLHQWQVKNHWHPDGQHGDQGNLSDVVTESTHLRVVTLPPSYTAIFDADMCPRDDIVIEHLQASRKLRNVIP